MALYVVMALFTIGEGFVVLLATRQELPSELYDLAAVEGASPWHVLRRVTLPLMMPTQVLLACRDVALALQATFVGVFLITDGGPDRSTLFLPVLVYDYAFEQLTYGYAAAVSLVLFAATLVLVFLLHRLLQRWRFGLLG
jgi:multiple sugar transport system permease protein